MKKTEVIALSVCGLVILFMGIRVLSYNHKSSYENSSVVSEESIKPEKSKLTEESPKIEKQNSNYYSSGQYKVGVDIPQGEYILYSNSGKDGSLYFCVSSDSNGNDIVFNDYTYHNSIITIKNGEYLELSKCYAVPFTGKDKVDTTGKYFMVKVGTDFPAGEYKLKAIDNRNGYYCIYNDSRRTDILSNDNFEGSIYVTVKNGDYFLVSNAKIVN